LDRGVTSSPASRRSSLRICIVSSCGGHLTEARCLLPAYGDHEYFYVLDDKALLPPDMQGRTHFVTHSERDWRTLVNFWEAWRLLRETRPAVILSTGAGIAVSFSLVGKLLFGSRIIFVETITRTKGPSLAARLMYWIADDFFYQWPSLARFFPRGRCLGPLI
jgi:UDP-N-acetylglucosamine:LPS N-acetylglucosamine transferase